MSIRPSIIETARASVAERIRSLGLLDAEAVLEHKAGNIPALFEEAIGKTGLCAMVGIASAKEEGSQTARIYWAPVKLFVAVVESALHQLAEPPPPGAWAVAEELVAALKLAALEENIFPQISDEPIKEIESDMEGSLVVRFTLDLRADGNTRSAT